MADEPTEIVENVALITEGPVAGHGVFADSVTLQQVKGLIDGFKNGIRSKLMHGSDIVETVGFINNAKIVGNQLLGDLHLLKSSPRFEFVRDMIKTMSDTFGMSIVGGGMDEIIGDAVFARFDSLATIDIVDRPAANPNGMFHAFSIVDTQNNNKNLIPKGKNPMDEKKFNELQESVNALTASNKALGEKLEAAESKIKSLSNPEDEQVTFGKLSETLKEFKSELVKELAPADGDKEFSEKLNEAVETQLKEFASKMGIKAVKPNTSGDEPNDPDAGDKKTFEEIVADAETQKQFEKASKSKVIAWCVRNHPEEYKAMRERQQNGERIDL